MSNQISLKAQRALSPPPGAMRSRRLSDLAEPQGLSVEKRASKGSTWLLKEGDRLVGYAIISSEGTLLEVFYEEAVALSLDAMFQELAGTAGLRSALCQSFDNQLISLATAVPGRVRTVGLLFCKIVDANHADRSDVSIRLAKLEDLDGITAIDEGFFKGEDEIREYLGIGGLFTLEAFENGIIGCGVAKPVLPNGTAVDIGMMVASSFRRLGYGAFIVSHLKSLYLSRNLRPICGCAIGNIGSQRAIQKAGFVADHKLLSFEY